MYVQLKDKTDERLDCRTFDKQLEDLGIIEKSADAATA
jgi:hypothetical protein